MSFSVNAKNTKLIDYENKIDYEINKYNKDNKINILIKKTISTKDKYILKDINFLDKRINTNLPITIKSVAFNKEAFDFYLKQKNNPTLEINNKLISEYKGISVDLDLAKKYFLKLKNSEKVVFKENDYKSTIEVINMIKDFSKSKTINGDIILNINNAEDNYHLFLNVDVPKLSLFSLDLETNFNNKKEQEKEILQSLKLKKLNLINDIKFNLGTTKKYYKEKEWNELLVQAENVDFINKYLQAINENKKYRLEFKLLEPINVSEVFGNIMKTIMLSTSENIQNGKIKQEIDKVFKYDLKTKIYN
tara:strand:+ start:38197 stop:39114 length:918 start_codon:yes stop_codon:yes gene_type:complete